MQTKHKIQYTPTNILNHILLQFLKANSDSIKHNLANFILDNLSNYLSDNSHSISKIPIDGSILYADVNTPLTYTNSNSKSYNQKTIFTQEYTLRLDFFFYKKTLQWINLSKSHPYNLLILTNAPYYYRYYDSIDKMKIMLKRFINIYYSNADQT